MYRQYGVGPGTVLVPTVVPPAPDTVIVTDPACARQPPSSS
jgi:hypothetical protein